MMRTNDCTAAVTAGRLAKMREFADGAAILDALAEGGHDSAATLYIHAGIAAADVLCCRALGRHAQGQSHTDAVALLRTVDVGAARHLQRLLDHKTRAGYGSRALSATDHTKIRRAAVSLVEVAEAG